MTQDEIITFVIGLPGVVAVTASEANGAPEVAWVAILNPGEATTASARSLLTDAHALAVQRYERRRA